MYFDSKLKFCTFKTSSLTCGPVSDEEEVRQDEATQEAQDSLPTCDSKCRLPDCFCSPDGTVIPGGLQANQVPQMILLSFSGAVNELVFDHYKKILGYSNKLGSGQSRLNPNGCGIRSTFFVSHEYTSYAQIHWLAAQQHEMVAVKVRHVRDMTRRRSVADRMPASGLLVRGLHQCVSAAAGWQVRKSPGAAEHW